MERENNGQKKKRKKKRKRGKGPQGSPSPSPHMRWRWGDSVEKNSISPSSARRGEGKKGTVKDRLFTMIFFPPFLAFFCGNS